MEWKFARTKLWLNFIDNGSTLPVPFNIIPTPMTCVNSVQFIKKFLSDESVFITSQPRSNAFMRVSGAAPPVSSLSCEVGILAALPTGSFVSLQTLPL